MQCTPHLITCLGNGANKVHRIAFEYRVLGEHSGSLEQKIAIEELDGCALYPNNDIETWPNVVAIENQHPPMHKPHPV